jgi:regulator of protease activity HflC (stomatin/prohibitin superfamily)
MTRLVKVGPKERLLVESGINHLRLLGPGLIWLKPWQRKRAKLYVGPNPMTINCSKVRVEDDIPVNLTIKVIYQINANLLNDDLLPRVPGLNEGGWHNIVHWRTEAVVRRLLARYRWQQIKEDDVQEQLEQHLRDALIERLKIVALDVIAVTIVSTDLDDQLQRTVVQAEQSEVEARGRATVLKKYFEIFGDSLPQAMPYIIQWELLNMLHKKGNQQLLLTAAGLTPDSGLTNAGLPQPVFQMKLPSPQDRQDFRVKN